MAARLYTPEEASILIPEMISLISKLQKHQDKVRQLMGKAEYPIPPVMYNLGSRVGSDMAAEFISIENVIEKIKSYGGQIKDIDDGLIDFPGLIDGREVWLCWKMGEDAITHFHDFGKGFNDRKKI
ncbi:MAG: hypothetical protein ACI9EW_002932 [Cellvibrionaceae bacterium]|jgi:hypothetical protein